MREVVGTTKNNPTRQGFLDRPFPIWLRAVFVVACAFVPTAYMVKQYEKRPDLTQLILFSQNFRSRQLPQVQALHPVTESPDGYDGQFYAQLAIDPTLRQPELRRAIDDASFRGQRIFLPIIAHVLGRGKPASILFIYALLNLFFFYLLLSGLLFWMRAATSRDFLAIFAIMLTSGALVSMQRALTDLPAAVLGTLGLMTSGVAGAGLTALAILTKPTSGLFLLRYAAPFPRTLPDLGRQIGLVFIVLVPFGIWLAYLHHAFCVPGAPADLVWPFDWPFRGMIERSGIFWRDIRATPFHLAWQQMTPWEWSTFALLTLISLTVQAAYILVRPQWGDCFWRVGAGFALMFFCLSSGELVEELNFNRTVLMLTFAFNILLWRQGSGLSYAALFFLGNFGLLLHFHDMIVFLRS